jgi:hypothetical protein
MKKAPYIYQFGFFFRRGSDTARGGDGGSLSALSRAMQ